MARRKPAQLFLRGPLPETWLTSQIEGEPGAARAFAPRVDAAHQELMAQTRVRWQLYVDRVTGAMALIEGGGLPWIPGNGVGNSLTGYDLGLDEAMPAPQDIPVAILEKIARRFMSDHPSLFAVDSSSLVRRFLQLRR